MTKYFYLIFFIVSLSGCSSLVNTITIKRDGSAIVETARELDNSDLDRYKSTSIITNIDTNGYRVTFNISNIDSLGNYLPYFQRGFMQFNLENNIFTITDGNTDAFKVSGSSCACCVPKEVDTFVKLDQEILELNYENSFVYKTKNNTIAILKTSRQLTKNKGKINLIVKLGPESIDTLK